MTPDVERLADTVRERLRRVGDPCSVAMGSPTDIVSLGLLGDVRLAADGVLSVTLVLTDPSCWFFFDFAQAIETELKDLPGVRSVAVSIDQSEIWTPERMSRRLPLTVLRAGVA